MNAKITPEKLTEALRESWSEETSRRPDEVAAGNVARGQCVVSSLVVQDYLGGELYRYKVSGDVDEMHYCNKLSDGTLLDTAISQYDAMEVTLEPDSAGTGGYQTVREKLLADGDTARRYELLKKRVAQKLGQ